MKTLHIDIDATTYRAAENMAALQGITPEDLLSRIVEKLTPILDKADTAAAAEISLRADIVAGCKKGHTRTKLSLSWDTWQKLSDYCQYQEERPARIAALLAAALPAAMLDALQLTTPEYRQHNINLSAILNQIN